MSHRAQRCYETNVIAPHKFKGGVSGCVRECAEAQSKDFGLIATDKGWNSQCSAFVKWRLTDKQSSSVEMVV